MINLELSITCKTIDIMHGAMWNLRGNLQIQRGFFGFVESQSTFLGFILGLLRNWICA